MDERTLERPISTDPGFPTSEPLENQGLQEPKIDLSKSPRHLRFEEVNAVTLKLTDGRGSLVPACHGYWSGYSTTRAIAWLMGIGNGLWIIRYRDKASRLMKLPAARKYALEMVKGTRPGIILDDPVSHLNKITAAVMNARDSGPCIPIEPELVDYIREVETGGRKHGG